MPELCSIECRDFVFVIWSKDLTKSTDRLLRTIEKRGGKCAPSEVRFDPSVVTAANEQLRVYRLTPKAPVFFENTQYDLDFIFRSHVVNSIGAQLPIIEHPVQAVEDAFHYSRHTASLRGSFNTRNSVGRFSMDLIYSVAGEIRRYAVSFDVHPTKMNMEDDLVKISAAVESVYPLWLYTLPSTTSHSHSSGRRISRSYLLFWLTRFEVLQEDLHSGLKTVLATPHGKLVAESRMVRLDRVKGRLTARHEQSAGVYKANGWVHKRLVVGTKYSSVDNPENRFIKQVVNTAVRRLETVLSVLQNADCGRKERLSASFVGKLCAWRDHMRSVSRHPLFNEVGDYSETGKESMVLQKKAGYSKVYSTWQRLKWPLDAMAGENGISLRTMAEMYEVWAFLEVRRILLELGFEEVSTKGKMVIRTVVSANMVDGKRGAFRLTRDDGVNVYLSHEPEFSRRSNAVTSLTTVQIPDIYLNAVFPDGQEVAWIFDAKYRIDDSKTKGVDLVPDDAINQLHRYRDSLLSGVNLTSGLGARCRPVFGAYALYPGKFSQLVDANPYQEAIDNAGIGAFSLLPSDDSSGAHWLKEFLSEKLSVNEGLQSLAISDKATLSQISRTGFSGTFVEKYRELVIVANQIGPGRAKEYASRFDAGTAPFYHMRCVASDRQRIAEIVIREARFIAIATDNPDSQRAVRYVYPISKVDRVVRSSLSIEQAGVMNTDFLSEYYWSFQLGYSFELKRPMNMDPDHHFRLYLSGLDCLSTYDHVDKLPFRYEGVELSG